MHVSETALQNVSMFLRSEDRWRASSLLPHVGEYSVIACNVLTCIIVNTADLGWWRSIVVRPPVLAGKLSLSCTRLMAGRVTTLWVRRPLSVNQHGQLSLPSLRGRLSE